MGFSRENEKAHLHLDEFQIINRHYKVLIFNENPTIIMTVIFFKFIKVELVKKLAIIYGSLSKILRGP